MDGPDEELEGAEAAVVDRRRLAVSALIRGLRVRAGLSLNELARRSAIDPAYLHRIEHAPAERPVVPRRAILAAIGTALGLERRHLDDLLARAGYCPASVSELGGWDSALADVADVLRDDTLGAEDKAEFREVLRLVAVRWRTVPSTLRGGPASGRS